MPALIGAGVLAPAPYGLPVYAGSTRVRTRILTGGLVGKRNLQPRGFASTNTSQTYRIKYPVAVSASGLHLTFPAWSTSAAGTGDEATGNTVTLAAVYVEYLGTLYPVTFDGAASRDIASGDMATSDAVAGLSVVAGNTLYVRTYVTVPTGGRWPTLYGAVAYPDEVSRPSSNLANATGDLTGTGQSVSDLYGPVQIYGTPAAGQPTYGVTIFGDSIVAGVNDSFSDESQTGYWQRALYPGTRPYSFVALPGESAVQVLTSQGAKRTAIVGEHATYFVNEYGINDLQGGATLAQLQARVLSIAGLANDATVVKKVQQTLGPKSASTDGWVTTANQTTDGLNATRIQFNDWVRDGMPLSGGVAVATGTVGATRTGDPAHPYQGYLEVADLCETARNSGIWKAGYTSDGLHPGPTGNASIAAALDLATAFPDTGAAPAGGGTGGGGTGTSTLARDASSPAIRTSPFQGAGASQAWASNSFSPPASSLIVVVAQATQSFNNAWNTPTITDSLATHLTWTRVDTQADVTFSGADATVSVFWALCPTAQTGMTVTVTQSLGGSGQTITFSSVAVGVWTGHDTAGPIGAKVKGTLTANALSVALTPAGTAGSALLLAANNAAAASSASTAGTGEYLVDETHVGSSYAQVFYGTSAGPTITTAAQTLDLNGATARWQYIAYEIKGAAPASGTPYTSSPADQEPATDVATAIVDAARTAADQAGLTDAAVVASDGGRPAADPLGLTDATSVATDGVRTGSDALGLADAVVAVAANDRQLADALGMLDAGTAVSATDRQTSDQLALTDAASATLGAAPVTNDPVTLTDSITAAFAGLRQVADQLGITDAVSATIGATPAVDDIALLVDAVTTTSDASRLPLDQLPAADAAAASLDSARASADPLGITDQAAIAATRATADQAALTDQATAVVAATATAGDAAGITDTVSVALTGATTQAFGDSAQLSDSVTVTLARVVTADDLLALIDGQVLARAATVDEALAATDGQTLDRAAATADTIGLGDNATLTGGSALPLADALAVTDAVQVSLARVVTVADLLRLADTGAGTLDGDQVHDYEFAGHPDQRRWSGYLEPRSWEGATT